jgi:hypothetical protein
VQAVFIKLAQVNAITIILLARHPTKKERKNEY